MMLRSGLATIAGLLALLAAPALAAPVAGFGTLTPDAVQRPDLPLQTGCNEGYRQDEGEGSGEFFTEAGFIPDFGTYVVPVECEGSGTGHDKTGPGYTALVVASIERGTEHCGQYTDVWRVDCISDELERMARHMPRTGDYRQAKAEILEASAKLRALALQNADPKQPPARRTAKVGDTRRTTSRPIVAVAPDRVAATNRAANAVISELSTTLLRSPGASASTAVELARVAQAVDSTKVLLRSI